MRRVEERGRERGMEGCGKVRRGGRNKGEREMKGRERMDQ